MSSIWSVVAFGFTRRMTPSCPGDRQQVELERHAEAVFVLPASADDRPEAFVTGAS
jgi:hypothetical protein